jgi:molecular chaperone DnaK
MEGNEAVVIPNAEGKRTTHLSSLLLKRLKWEILQRQAVTNPTKTIASIKRFMGQGFGEVSAEKRVSYKIVKETTIHHVWILMVVYTLHKNCQQ